MAISIRRDVDVGPGPDVRFLHEVIRTVGSSLDLEQVLHSVVDLLSRAVRSHACYVFMLEGDGRMVLRACSEKYKDAIGVAALERGEGFAGWVAMHRQPVFISDRALDDSRMKVIDGLDETLYQSLASLPLIGRDGSVLGVVALHAKGPREYSEHDRELLDASASLVAGAIENAQLHRETARRGRTFEQLFLLTREIADTDSVTRLAPLVVERVADLVEAASAQLYLLDSDGEVLRLRAAAPAGSGPTVLRLREAMSTDARDILSVPIVVSGEVFGLLVVHGEEERPFVPGQRELVSTIAAQAAVALRRLQLVDRLAERNLIRDFFDSLAAGTSDELEVASRRLRFHFAEPHVVIAARSCGEGATGSDWPALLEAKLAALFRGALVERSESVVRAVIRCPKGADDAVTRLRTAHRELALPIIVGVSSACVAAPSYVDGFREARDAIAGSAVVGPGPGVIAYEDLGPYRYLLRIAEDGSARDPQRERLRILLDYDREHRSQLFRTIEEYLRQRGRIASTASALYVHPNTLRQRLARIETLTGLRLEDEDHLSLELAAKLLRLEDPGCDSA